VFEALPEAGGMMRVGIPAYRLPRKILDDEIEMVKSLGVEIKTGSRIDSLEKLSKDGYQAILIAVGAHQGIKAGIEGEDNPRVTDCVDFLRKVSLGEKVDLGDRVIVVGGGNAAIDSARTSLRLGAKDVTILYRRTRAEMPANAEEIEEALKEGVKMEFLAAPRKACAKNGTVEIESIRMKLGEPDASGRPRPEPIEGSEFTMEADSVIAAIGQRPDVPEGFKLELGRGNVVVADPETMIACKEGVFVAGDAVTGPASVVESIRTAKQAAVSIDRHLGGKGELPVDELAVKDPTSRCTFIQRWAQKEKRVEMPTLPIEDRLKGFDEVELGLTQEMAVAEGQRCWRCDLEE